LFGVGDEGDWRLFTYRRGLRSRPVKQEIGFGGDENGFTKLRFDQVDKEGTMMIREILARVIKIVAACTNGATANFRG